MAKYVLPMGLDNRRDLLWVHIIAREIQSQKAYARGGAQIQTGERLGEWRILAPNEFSEDVNHEWGEYESVASRLAQKIGDINRGISEYRGLETGARSAVGGAIQGSGEGISAQQGLEVIRLGAAGAAGTNVPKFKIDSSFVYQNTQRRTYSLNFNLSQFLEPNDALSQTLFRPVRELEKLSCPQLTDDLISIGFPAVFRVYTSPLPIIKINHAALTSVQPTWRGPYKNGVPSQCDLTLTFTDIEPLYRRSFEEGGIIRTSE